MTFRRSGLKKIKTLTFILTVFAVSLTVNHFVSGWTEPTVTPPGGNSPAPVNVSSDAQIKTGDLSVTTLYDTNDSNYYIDLDAPAGISAVMAGKVGIGTTDPKSNLHIRLEDVGGSNLVPDHPGDLLTRNALGGNLALEGNNSSIAFACADESLTCSTIKFNQFNSDRTFKNVWGLYTVAANGGDAMRITFGRDSAYHHNNTLFSILPNDPMAFPSGDGKVGINTKSPMSALDVTGSFSSSKKIADGYYGYKSGTIITRTSGPVFTAADVGRYFGWNNGITDRITAYTDASHVTVADSGTIASAANPIGGRTSIKNFNIDESGNIEASGGTGSVNLKLTADTDNSNEADQPSITFSQDNGAVTGQLGYFGSTNQLTLKNVFNDSLNLGTNNLNRLTILGGGNVGIGTANPAYLLDVNGAMHLQPTATVPAVAKGVIYYNSTDDKFKCYQGTAWVDCAGSGGAVLPAPGAAGQTLHSNGTNWVADSNVFNNGGNVGVGTATPGATLDVNGNMRISGTSEGYGTGISIPSSDIDVGGGADGFFGFRHSNAGAGTIAFGDLNSGGMPGGPWTMAINTITDRVGIGTTNPMHALHIKGSGAAGASSASLELEGDATISEHIHFSSPTQDFMIGKYDTDNFFIADSTAGGINRLVILKGSGNVGIGLNSPSQKLDINGAVKLEPSAVPGSPSNGTLYYDSTSNKFRCYQNGAWTDCIGAGGGGGNWTLTGSDIYNSNAGNVGIGTTTPPEKLSLSGKFAMTDSAASNYTTFWKDGRAGMEGITRMQSTTGPATADANAYTILSIDAPYNKTVQEATLGLVTDDQIFDLYNMTYAGATRWGLAYINGTADPAKWRDFNIGSQNGYGGPGTQHFTIKVPSGKVGIGNENPTDRLQITSNLSGADDSSIWIENTNPIDAKSRLRFTTDAGEFLISRTSTTYSTWPESAGDAVFNLLGPGGGPSGDNIRFLIDGGDRMIIKANGNVGIGTANAEFRLSLDSDGGIIAKGSYGSGASLTTSGAGTRMIWYPQKAAFRVGDVSGAQWDDANIGDYSFASGESSTASGLASNAMGSLATASGGLSTAIGNYVTASGWYGIAMGDGATASDTGSIALGKTVTSSGAYATAIGGVDAQANGFGATALGNSIQANGGSSVVIGTGASFSGVGADLVNNINNSLMVGFVSSQPTLFVGPSAGGVTTGNVGIATSTPGAKLEVNGGMRLNTTTARPACAAAARGTFWFVQGAAGVKDSVAVCAKDALNAYAWRTIY